MITCKHHMSFAQLMCSTFGKTCSFPCSSYEPIRKFKSFGWEVTVEFQDGHQERYHWRGITEGGARRKGMLKSLARRIVQISPVSEEQWERAFGIGRM